MNNLVRNRSLKQGRQRNRARVVVMSAPPTPHYEVPAYGDWSKSLFKERAQNVHVHFAGISESRNLLEEGLPLWKCAGDLRYIMDHSTKRDTCQQDNEWKQGHSATFLAACRESLARRNGGRVLRPVEDDVLLMGMEAHPAGIKQRPARGRAHSRAAQTGEARHCGLLGAAH